jgi:hypothetical protein
MRPFRSETKELSATKTAYTAPLRPLCGEYPSELSIFSVLGDLDLTDACLGSLLGYRIDM